MLPSSKKLGEQVGNMKLKICYCIQGYIKVTQ